MEVSLMSTLNTSLPEPMKAFIGEQVKAGLYGSASDYIRALVRADQQRQAQERLEAKLLAARESQDFKAVTPELFERLRARIHRNTLSQDHEG
jgi:antitoxin ParD1/3/4